MTTTEIETRAKAAGRGTFRFYNRAMTEVVRDRMALEADLGRALAQGELELWY